MSEQTILLIGTLGGAFIGALSGIAISWITKIYEENKNRRELIIKIAIDNWRVNSELLEKVALRTGKKVAFYPVDAYIVHHAKLADIIMKKKIKPKDLENALKEAEELQKTMDKFLKI